MEKRFFVFACETSVLQARGALEVSLNTKEKFTELLQIRITES